jgi:hypothetical protein
MVQVEGEGQAWQRSPDHPPSSYLTNATTHVIYTSLDTDVALGYGSYHSWQVVSLGVHHAVGEEGLD